MVCVGRERWEGAKDKEGGRRRGVGMMRLPKAKRGFSLDWSRLDQWKARDKLVVFNST